MHGKAHREPARHSVVLDCKLVQLQNTCQSLQKLANRSQPFLDQSPPHLGGLQGSPCRLISFFLIADIMFRCRVMFGQVQSRSKKRFLPSLTRGGKCPGEFGPNFSNSSHKWICVQVWLRSVKWPQRLGVEKRKKKETTAVKYKPFGIAMPCGLMLTFSPVNQSTHYICTV